MKSFHQLLTIMQESHETTEDKSTGVIRTGKNVDDKFWDNFLLVINNSEGLSELLDVPESKISTWHDKIKNALLRVHATDSPEKPKKYQKMIKTGLPKTKNPDKFIKDEDDPNAEIS